MEENNCVVLEAFELGNYDLGKKTVVSESFNLNDPSKNEKKKKVHYSVNGYDVSKKTFDMIKNKKFEEGDKVYLYLNIPLTKSDFMKYLDASFFGLPEKELKLLFKKLNSGELESSNNLSIRKYKQDILREKKIDDRLLGLGFEYCGYADKFSKELLISEDIFANEDSMLSAYFEYDGTTAISDKLDAENSQENQIKRLEKTMNKEREMERQRSRSLSMFGTSVRNKKDLVFLPEGKMTDIKEKLNKLGVDINYSLDYCEPKYPDYPVNGYLKVDLRLDNKSDKNAYKIIKLIESL